MTDDERPLHVLKGLDYLTVQCDCGESIFRIPGPDRECPACGQQIRKVEGKVFEWLEPPEVD